MTLMKSGFRGRADVSTPCSFIRFLELLPCYSAKGGELLPAGVAWFVGIRPRPASRHKPL